jgi:hypothetical protein
LIGGGIGVYRCGQFEWIIVSDGIGAADAVAHAVRADADRAAVFGRVDNAYVDLWEFWDFDAVEIAAQDRALVFKVAITPAIPHNITLHCTEIGFESDVARNHVHPAAKSFECTSAIVIGKWGIPK